ncbi:hypothetical protein BJX70DRAFT_410929 [Aspergillus crustosus]
MPDSELPIDHTTLYISTITSSVLAAACFPPNTFTILTYANAFLSVAFALRAVELLITNPPNQLKRLEKVSDDSSSSPVYVWKPIPPALTFERLLRVYDLLINPRGIGWTHGSKQYLPQLKKVAARPPPAEKGNGPHSKRKDDLEDEKFILENPTQDRLQFLAIEAFKLAVAYTIYDSYRTVFGRHYAQLCLDFHSFLTSTRFQHALEVLSIHFNPSPETCAELVQRFILPPACWAACYAFIDGIRAAVALFGVGALHLISPTLAHDPWMYPAMFGPWRYIFWPKLKDIWGKFWHDLCRRALITSSIALVPRCNSKPFSRFHVGILSFVISGVVHAAGTYAVTQDPHAVFMIMGFFITLPFFITVQEVVIWIFDATYLWWWGYHTAPWFFSYSMIPESLASIPIPERWSLWERS